MLRGVLHHTKQQLHGHLPPISQTTQDRQARQSKWSKDTIINKIIQYTPTCEHSNIGQPANSNIPRFYADIECHLEDLASAIASRDEWLERESMESVLLTGLDDDNGDIYIYIYICVCVCVCVFFRNKDQQVVTL